jgi:hypothetical protein
MPPFALLSSSQCCVIVAGVLVASISSSTG